MAKTAFSTSDTLTKKYWDEKLFRDIKKDTYFSKFAGDSKDSIVYEKRQLEKQKGDTIYFGLRMRLEGDGVEDGDVLEGNEEALNKYSHTLALKRYRHAVRDEGGLDRQRAMFSIDDESLDAIKTWGEEKIDKLTFDALFAARTKVFYTTSTGTAFAAPGTAKTALTASYGKLTLGVISLLKTWAKTGGARTYIPFRPVRIQGKDYYVMLCHPDAMYDLKASSAWQQAQREAMERGSSNPLFTGAAGVWDGVIIHEHESVPIAADAGASSNVPWAKCAFLGAQALCFAWGSRLKVTQKKFDYEEEHGYSIAFTGRAGRTAFNSLDFGSVELHVARTNVSGLV